MFFSGPPRPNREVGLRPVERNNCARRSTAEGPQGTSSVALPNILRNRSMGTTFRGHVHHMSENPRQLSKINVCCRSVPKYREFRAHSAETGEGSRSPNMDCVFSYHSACGQSSRPFHVCPAPNSDRNGLHHFSPLGPGQIRSAQMRPIPSSHRRGTKWGLHGNSTPTRWGKRQLKRCTSHLKR